MEAPDQVEDPRRYTPALIANLNAPLSQQVFNYVNANVRDGIEPSFLNFGTLHQFNLARIQQDIACWKEGVIRKQEGKEEEAASQADMDDLKRLLHEYATAIRDYEYMSNLVPLSEADREKRLFALHSHFQLPTDPYNSDKYLRLPDPQDELRKFLMRSLPPKLAYSKDEKKKREDEYFLGKTPVHVSEAVDRIAQFLLALIGGASLIVPMLIMSIHPSKKKSLITVSVATFVFSFVLSMALKLQNNDVLAATAAYAAVLVVFVGTST